MRYLILRFLFFIILLVNTNAQDRALNLGLSYNHLLSNDLAETDNNAPGLFLAYEFILSPSFHLGIETALRRYAGANSAWQLGYGLLLKHYLFYDSSKMWHPYISYGL